MTRSLGRLTSIAQLDEAYELHPELFEEGYEYDKGCSPEELAEATEMWSELLDGRTYRCTTH
jgi:hypothetical protein